MSSAEEQIRSLRDAVKVSPDNPPLRKTLAEALTRQGLFEEAESEWRAAMDIAPADPEIRRRLAELLLRLNRLPEAEAEYRQALGREPANVDTKMGLARAFYQQAKYSESLVIVEDILGMPNPPAGANLLYARLLLRNGEVEQAKQVYRKALEKDATLANSDLAEKLGIAAPKDSTDRDAVVDGRVRLPAGDVPPEPDTTVERPSISFKDVGGMDKIKDEIRMKIIYPLKNPDMFKAYGKTVGGGILLFGPPGCGKTYLARATAGEVRAGFLAIGIHDVLDMWIGQSERNLHELFEQARRNAPCVLFFDEVDALGASRTDMRQSAGRQLINQFLSELDGVQKSNEGVLILAATNAPWHLDSAFRRPGRFDRIVFVPPPDAPARASILRVLIQGKPAEDIEYDDIAKKTDGFSGADMKALIDVAVESKLREAMKAGAPSALTTGDLLAAAKGLKPSTKEWFATARNYALYSNQSGIYDDIKSYLKM